MSNISTNVSTNVSWAQNIAKQLIKECQINIGDEIKQIALRKNGEIKHYDIKYKHLMKQKYSRKEFNDKINLIINNKNKIIEKYDCENWSDLIFENIINIADYIYEDYINNTYDTYFQIITLYNNIIINIENDCDISISHIEFNYIEDEINKNDLKVLKEVFAFFIK